MQRSIDSFTEGNIPSGLPSDGIAAIDNTVRGFIESTFHDIRRGVIAMSYGKAA